MKTPESIEFTRITNDVNGSPRYVCHFLNLVTEVDERHVWADYATGAHVGQQYAIALKRAKKIGGKKFHNKQYGGGIVFQSYNIGDTAKQICELVNESK